MPLSLTDSKSVPLRNKHMCLLFLYPMFVLFLLGLVGCSSILKTLAPRQVSTFYEVVTKDDQYINLSLSLLSQDQDVFYRIFPPDLARSSSKRLARDFSGDSLEMDQSTERSADLDSFELPLVRNLVEKLEVPGVYVIQLYNRGSNEIKFSISSLSIKKMTKANEDITELRNLLNSLQGVVDVLGNENYYARNIQDSNIREAKRIRSTLNWLILMPIFTFVIAYLKYVLARQLVRPKGKRFKGLF